MTRCAHLVGAVPGRSEAYVMDRVLEELGPHLLRLSDGETGARAQWMAPIIDTFRAHPDVELTGRGDNTSYEDVDSFKLRDGHELEADTIILGYAAAFRRSYPQFRVLRERHGRPDLRFQVGVVAPGDLAGALFGEQPPTERSVMPFVEATLREVGEIVSEVGTDEVVFQLETVASLVGVAMAPPEARATVADQIASGLTSLIAGAPDGTRWGLHLCMGDFNHKAYVAIGDVSPWVDLGNAIARSWPAGRVFEYLHAPFAAAEEPPPDDAAFYAPVANLSLPEGTRFVAGFIHEKLDPERHREIQNRIESLYGHEVDVAAACGLARRSDPQEAWDSMAVARALIENHA